MRSVTIPAWVLVLVVGYLVYYLFGDVTWYQISTALVGVNTLLKMPQSDIDGCIKAYNYFQNVSVDRESNTEEETEHVRSYYTVLNQVLAIADIEKMYIPPQLNSKQGLYQNQLAHEQLIFANLNVSGPGRRVLDVGCGRGRIAHHFAQGQQRVWVQY
jgi:sterol 24-C-methyltransferase